MPLHQMMTAAVLLVLCQTANASFNTDQSMLDDLDVGHSTIPHLVATERLFAATGSMLHLPSWRQRVRADISAAPTSQPQLHTLRITRRSAVDQYDGNAFDEERVRFSHDHLYIQQGDHLALELEGYQHDEVEVYVRDPSIAALQNNALNAMDVGNSEVIFIVAKALHILPLTVTARHTAAQQDKQVLQPTEQITVPADAAVQFSATAQPSLYGEIEIQVVDERSYDSYLYPVDNIDLRILGADMELRTDAQGKVRVMGLPLQGRILVEFSDPLGRYVSGFQEITLDANVRSYRLIALRTITADSIATISGKVRHAQLASMCGELEQGEAFRVEVDAPADGVFYFNRLGLLDRQQRDTALFPRFCVLNADPGPLTLFVKDAQGEQVGAFSVSLAAGHHTEETFNLWTDTELQLRLSTHGIVSYKRQLVDSAQVRMLGVADSLPTNNGLVDASPSYHQQRSHLLVEDPDFEQTLHALEQQGNPSVLSLLPRGTLAYIALQANIPYDASMGSVYAEIGYEDADDIRLISADGHEIMPTWLSHRTPMVAAFLNLPFGVYQLLVKNSSGHWLAVQTLMVYNESVSQLRIGYELRYRATD